MPGPISLYLHIPFCAARCPFCDFAISLEEPSARFVEALTREIRAWGGKLGRPRLGTIHLGGGTPSRMPVEMMEKIFAALQEAFEVPPGIETALECNPGDADLAKFQAWKALGVNRLSVGAQSFHDQELAWIGRQHGVREIRETVALAKQAGFGNVSLDLMYGLPGQMEESWAQTLGAALSLNPQHVSVYALTLTGGKKLQGPPPPSDDLQAGMAAHAIDRLEAAGIGQYEISNFARPGFESRHNLAYWTFQPYLGLGPSAHSYLPPRRFANVAQTPEYVERVLSGRDPMGFEEILTPQQEALERLFLGLRLPAGIGVGSLGAGAESEIQALHAEGLVLWQEERLALTRRGKVLVDAVTERLTPHACVSLARA